MKFPWKDLPWSLEDRVGALFAAHGSLSLERVSHEMLEAEYLDILRSLEGLVEKGVVLVGGDGTFQWSDTPEATLAKSRYKKHLLPIIEGILAEVPENEVWQEAVDQFKDLEVLWLPWLERDVLTMYSVAKKSLEERLRGILIKNG